MLNATQKVTRRTFTEKKETTKEGTADAIAIYYIKNCVMAQNYLNI
jgi:hypothetical protein